jgi:hypothetical protein
VTAQSATGHKWVPTALPSVAGFIIASYVAIGLGLGLAMAAYPALVAHQLAMLEIAAVSSWFTLPGVQVVLDIALVAQLCVVLIQRLWKNSG